MARTKTEQLDSMFSTTWYLRLKKTFDQVFAATPFWLKLKSMGKVTSQIGGKQIKITLRYGKNESVQFVGKGGSVTLEDTDNLTDAFYDWRYLTGHIIRYFTDYQQNRGKAQLIKKVNSDIDTLKESVVDKLESSLHGDGTGSGGLAIDGLDNIVAEDPTTGTVGGINRATYSWWRNRYKDMSGRPTTLYLRKDMRSMFNECGKLGDGITRFPNLCITCQSVHELYEEECSEATKIVTTDKKLADLGFGDSAFKGRPIVWSPSCKAQSLYFLNLNFLEYIYDPLENFELGEWLSIVNQPRDKVVHMMSVGNLTCSNCSRQGVMFDITESGS